MDRPALSALDRRSTRPIPDRFLDRFLSVPVRRPIPGSLPYGNRKRSDPFPAPIPRALIQPHPPHPPGADMSDTQTDDTITYVDSVHQRSAHGHVHLRSTDECLTREAGELCPSWRERAEAAEAKVARVESLLVHLHTDLVYAGDVRAALRACP